MFSICVTSGSGTSCPRVLSLVSTGVGMEKSFIRILSKAVFLRVSDGVVH